MSTQYEPEVLPEITAESLYRELSRISQSIGDVYRLPVLYAQPDKPRQGVLVYADGTQWDPGSGEGVYRYDGTTWNYLG